MNVAQWSQMPDAVTIDAGYYWTPEDEVADIDWSAEAGTGSVLECAEYLIQDYPMEFPSGYQTNPSHFSSADSSYSQEYDTPGNNEEGEGDDSGMSRTMGRPRFPVQSTRDASQNRIQRRRIQNRNSQRTYRQRRVEERHKFETRASEAENTVTELRAHLAELHAIVAALRHQVEQLKAENVALRGCNRCQK